MWLEVWDIFTTCFDLSVVRYLVSLVFGVISTVSFAGILYERRKRNRLILVTLALLVIQLLLFVTMGMQMTFYLYPLHTHLPLILCLIWFWNCSVWEATMYTLLAYMCCQIPAWISKAAVIFPHGGEALEFGIYIVAAVVTVFAIYRYAGKPVYELIKSSRKTSIVFGIIPITYYFFDYLAVTWTDILYTGEYLATQFMPFVVCVVYLVFAVVLNKEQKKRIQADKERAIYENELHIVETEVESLGEMERMSRIYRHDMRHHLAIIKHMISQKRISDAEKYIEENVRVIDSFTPQKFCDMEMLNLLLSHFKSRSRESGTDCHFDIALPENIPLSNIELCALVSNALENAFEASEDIPVKDRKIDVKLCEFNQKMVFSVDNVCKDGVCIIDNNPYTAREGHGYGTKSIRTIAQNHNGMATFTVNNNQFSLMVMIPLT